MKSNDYIGFITKELIKKMSVNEKATKSKNENEKQSKSVMSEMFGVLPLGLQLVWKRTKKKDDRTG
ncbi:MAG: YqzE family protein [Bacilli bacterium]